MSSTREQFDGLAARYHEAPRAVRWAILAGGFLVLFLIWDSWIKPVGQAWAMEADRIERTVEDVREGEALMRKLNQARLESTIVNLGPLEQPGSDAQGRTELSNAVIETLREHGVKDHSFDLRLGGKLPAQVSSGVTDQGKRLVRLTGDLRFEAKPDVVIAVIADLERRAEIEAVTSVRLTRATGVLRVRLDLEAWVIEPGRRS